MLDRLEGVHLDPRIDDGVLADEGLVAEDDAFLQAGAPAQVAGAAHDRPAQAHARAEVDVVVYHRPLDEGVRPDPHVRTEHGVLGQPGAGIDPAVVADDGRAVHVRRRIDLRTLPEPDAVTQPEAGDVDDHLGVEHVLVGLDVGVEGADVLPVPLGHVAEQRDAVFEQPGKDVGREVDRLLRLDVVEDVGLEHVDAGVDGVGENLSPGGLLQEPLDRAVLPGDDDAELQRVLHGLQADGHDGLLFPVKLDDAGQVDVGEDVAGDDEERFVQLVHGVADGSGRAERVLFGGVDHPHPELRAVAEVGSDGVGLKGHGDDDVLEAVLLQEMHDVLHHGPVGDGHHRLGLVGREGAQPGALPARHDDRLHIESLLAAGHRLWTARPAPWGHT